METLTLNDGAVLENSYVYENTDINSLFVYTRNEYTLGFVFDLLYDPEKTSRIVYTKSNGEEIEFEQYQRLTAVTDEGHGMVTAVLKKVYSEE